MIPILTVPTYVTTMLSYGEGPKKTFLEYLEYFYWDDHREYDADSNLAIARKNLEVGEQQEHGNHGAIARWYVCARETHSQ